MKSFKHTGAIETIILNLEPGDLIKECIEQVAEEYDIKVGAVLCGFSALRTASLHHIKHIAFPGDDELYKITKPMEMTSLQGVIINHKAHVHMQCMSGKSEAIGGHLENGSEVAYLAEIIITKYIGIELERYKHELYAGVDQLRKIGDHS